MPKLSQTNAGSSYALENLLLWALHWNHPTRYFPPPDEVINFLKNQWKLLQYQSRNNSNYGKYVESFSPQQDGTSRLEEIFN